MGREGGNREELVRRMCGRIVYRGPDDEGYYTGTHCSMGMRRLSIVDLSGGHQPIGNEDGTVWVVFNGEIYNHEELRRGLEGRGHRYKTRSDTETIVHLYEEYGHEAWAKLRGMYAIAVFDERRGEVILVRDRFGKKPLYVAKREEGLYFGSELGCLKEAGVCRGRNEKALMLYMQFSYVPDPWCVYEGVEKMPGGTWLSYDRHGKVERGRYWKLPEPLEAGDGSLSLERAREELKELFDEAVRIRLMADVPLGAFLSGGLDSGSVVASMARQTSEPVRTFTIGFEEAAFNETDGARMVADKYGTSHQEMILSPDIVGLVERISEHFGEPFGDSSAIPTLLVSEFAARHVKVALTGDGGDELFAGYESFQLVERLRRWDVLPGWLRGVIGEVAGALPYSAYGKNYLGMISQPGPVERYFESNYAPRFLLERLVERQWLRKPGVRALQEDFPDCFLPMDRDVLTQALYYEATAKLSGDMLVKVDRMSMAASLEVRSPLLDHKLAEFAARLPHAWKIGEGKGKKILREALGDRLPEGLLSRPKMGFGVPLRIWFRGPLREYLREHLGARTFLESGLVKREQVVRLIEEHESGRRDNSHWLWMLLMLGLWLKKGEEN